MQKNILFTIKEKMADLTNAEKKLACWILDHSTDVIHMNVKSLSKSADVSPATIVRFCYSLGLEGFSDLKLHLSTNLGEIKEGLYSDIVKDEETSQIKKKLKLKATHAFEETMLYLDDKIMDAVVKEMDKAEITYTFGIGASGLVAEDIYQKLSRIGKNVFFTKDQHLLATSLVTNSQTGIFFAISNSGEKKELIQLAQIAKKQRKKIIVITHAKESSLAKSADFLLLTASGGEAPLRSAATSSLLVQLFTVDILYTAYASRHYESIIKNVSESKKIIDELTT